MKGDSSVNNPTTSRRRFLGAMGAMLSVTAVQGCQTGKPAAGPDKNGELIVFNKEFTWSEERPFFCWSPFAPGLNRPGLRGVKEGPDEPAYEPFDPGISAYPDNWMEPNDYWNGTWPIRYQFKERPSDRPGRIQVGIWSEMVDRWKSWKETVSERVHFSGRTGTFFGDESESPARTWWRLKKDEPVDFSRVCDFTYLGFAMWTNNNKVLHPAESLREKGGWYNDGREDYFPCVIRATVIAVPAGRTFSGWENYP
jgi:hypothetical protein